MATIDGKFSCAACGKRFIWVEASAGKSATCKCGATVRVPMERPTVAKPEAASVPPPPKPAEDDLFDLAPDDLPPVSFAKSATPELTLPRSGGSTAGRAALVPGRAAAAAPTLGYQRGATAREKQLGSRETFIDNTRDVTVPIALLAAGYAMYILYFASHYRLGIASLAGVGVGVTLLVLFKTVLLVGFAFVVATPLGVSFGGLWTAILKLAAIAVFSDGVTTWIDAGMDRITGGFGSGMISFPITLGLFWVLLIYLFSMDSGDSWIVVILLAAFDIIVRMVLVAVLLTYVLRMGGVAPAAIPGLGGGGGGSGSGAAVSSEDELIAELKQKNLLREAREHIAGGRQFALTDTVNGLYAAGCPNVWFSMSLAVDRKAYADELVVELPTDPAKRAEAYKVLKLYYANMKFDPDDDNLDDAGEKYLFAPLK